MPKSTICNIFRKDGNSGIQGQKMPPMTAFPMGMQGMPMQGMPMQMQGMPGMGMTPGGMGFAGMPGMGMMPGFGGMPMAMMNPNQQGKKEAGKDGK